MRRFWLATVVLLGTSCGLLPGSAPAATSTPAATQVAPSASPAVTSSPSPTAAAPSAAKPTAAATPTGASNAKTVYVGNTDGEGVYVRNTPNMADRAKAYADGTALTIIGDDVDGDDQHWHHVRTPDGLEGYVPSIYTTDAPG